jgi:hypothetical protein
MPVQGPEGPTVDLMVQCSPSTTSSFLLICSSRGVLMLLLTCELMSLQLDQKPFFLISLRYTPEHTAYARYLHTCIQCWMNTLRKDTLIFFITCQSTWWHNKCALGTLDSFLIIENLEWFSGNTTLLSAAPLPGRFGWQLSWLTLSWLWEGVEPNLSRRQCVHLVETRKSFVGHSSAYLVTICQAVSHHPPSLYLFFKKAGCVPRKTT